MKNKIIFPLLCTLALVGAAAAVVFGVGRAAEQAWQEPTQSAAPIVTDTAVEQVESELKAYPYQVLTLSAAQVLYREITEVQEYLSERTEEDGISAGEAAAIAGGYAQTLYGSDLSGKTLDLLPVTYQNDKAGQYRKLWLAAYTLPDAVQITDGGAFYPTQGCWLFCLDAADGALLYSRCTALEGDTDKTVYMDSDPLMTDEEMRMLYERSLALAEELSLAPAAFYGVETLDRARGIVLTAFLKLEDGRLCRMDFDKYYRTDSLYAIAVGGEDAFIEQPRGADWLPLPLQAPSADAGAQGLPSAVTLAAQGDYSLGGKSQSASFSAADADAVYVNSYNHFAERDFLLYRFDPATSKRSLLCTDEKCSHSLESTGCASRTDVPYLSQIFAADGHLYALPYDEHGYCKTIEQLYPTARTICSFADESTAHIIGAIAVENTLYAVCRTGDDTAQGGPISYDLYRIDAATGEYEQLCVFFEQFVPSGRLGNYLLLWTSTECNIVVETEAGLQPRDAGRRDMLFALDLSTRSLTCIYDGREDDHNLVDIENGRLWRANWVENGLQVTGQDLFTGQPLPDVPDVFLEDDTPSNSLAQMELAGDYLLLRQWGDNDALYHMIDTTTGQAKELPITDAHDSQAILAVFGDEALVQRVDSSSYEYYYLSLPALFEGRIERRRVTDDFVIG